MLNTPVHHSGIIKNLFPLQKQFLSSNPPSLLVNLYSSCKPKKKNAKLGFFVSNIKAVAGSATDLKAVSVKVIVTVKKTSSSILSNLGIEQRLDDITDLFGKSLVLELVSTELDPRTGQEKRTIKGNARQVSKDDEDVKYEAEFEVPAGFGDIGAVLVENEHHKEMFFESIILDGLSKGAVNVTCNSWVHSKYDNPQKRVFFTHKSYLPSETPAGLRRLREEELAILRGNGKGERKTFERIYDYDVYNDLGDPDSDPSTKRPVLGGEEIPYPRRCRTGGPPSDSDPLSEKKSSTVYVPRDEAFTTVKAMTVAASAAYSLLHAVVPLLESAVTDPNSAFPSFTAIDELYDEGIHLPPNEKLGFWNTTLPRIFSIVDESQSLLRFEIPETIKRDKFFWLRDEEFGRQTLAGLNPFSLELVKKWPLKSKLDPKVYGPAESAITAELIEREIKGIMSFDEALKQKKLFIIDFHDILLPYVEKVRALEGRTFYGSRTVFFLNPDETLRPLAIELTRPPMDGKPQWKEVYSPTWNSTGVWLWRLAKAHAISHNAINHQLVSHWLRTHCVVEPYIIATHRQLSEMHPIYQLLHPHFRFTMEINATARGAIVSSNGIMENSYAPGKYYMELGAGFYKDWRFDTEGLPADLIQRGLAVEDSSAPHGLKLLIKDYPYANDGLLLWDALNQWVSDYVNHYYKNPSSITSDQELQSWWTEIRTIGHGDKKDEPWWPELKTPQDLISIVTTIAWVASGHHAAANYGIYDLGGYFPGWPTTARTKMPTEDPSEEDWKVFLETPETALLRCFPSKIQAIRSITAWDLLSYHSADEEYVGGKLEPAWGENPEIKAAFERFAAKLKESEGIIDGRNADGNLRNRSGAGTVPYELLKPFSEAGVTGKGVPNSITV